MPNGYWILFILFLLGASFGLGMYTEHKFNLASLEKEEVKVADKAQLGEQNIVKFHQQMSKNNVKTPCDTTAVPSATIKLLY